MNIFKHNLSYVRDKIDSNVYVYGVRKIILFIFDESEMIIFSFFLIHI